MEVPERRRDAGRTRQRLLDAARRRFAADGFASTTVRQVADEAGVDVALIKRYYGSKEGLFEACLAAAVDDLRSPADDGGEHTDLAARLAHHALGTGAWGASSEQALMLLLRSSGDEAVDDLRRRVLHEHSERIARRSGGGGAATSATELLRAQVVLAAVIGIAVLRSSSGLQPLSSATPDHVAEVLRPLLASQDASRAVLEPQPDAADRQQGPPGTCGALSGTPASPTSPDPGRRDLRG